MEEINWSTTAIEVSVKAKIISSLALEGLFRLVKQFRNTNCRKFLGFRRDTHAVYSS